MIKLVTVDYSKMPTITVVKVLLDNGEEWLVSGSCKQCGRCCTQPQWPEYLGINKDGSCGGLVRQISKCTCKAYWNRPMCCALYPVNPYADKIDGCGFLWEKK